MSEFRMKVQTELIFIILVTPPVTVRVSRIRVSRVRVRAIGLGLG